MINIRFVLSYDSRATVEVFNFSGQRVETLFKGRVDAQAEQQVTFEPTREGNKVYLYRITTDKKVVSGRLVSLKR